MSIHATKRLKTAQVNLRIAPELKAAAELAAADDRRSLTSLVEKLLDGHLRAGGYLKDASALDQLQPGKKQ